MDKNNSIRDDEELYRRVRINTKNVNDTKRYSDNTTGPVEIYATAFFDRSKQPSVDRAKLRGFNPTLSQIDETDGIVSLIAGEIRAIPIQDHAVNIIHDPTSKNPAHSQITITLEGDISNTKRNKAFRTLRKALAILATEKGWTLEPSVN
jgi:hypothetical protein